MDTFVRYFFCLNLDTFMFVIMDRVEEDNNKTIDMHKVKATAFNPRRYFVEEMDTPGLSMDSEYHVFQGGEDMVVAKATDMLPWLDMAIAAC